MDNIQLKNLTSQETVNKQKVKSSYFEFWDNIRFKRGWDTPAFRREDVESFLDVAAEVVTRVRSVLDKKKPAPSRVPDGSAKEYMWALHSLPEDSESFIKGVVLANFMNLDGYVEGLKEEYLTKQVDIFLEAKENSKKISSVVNNIGSSLESVNNLWNSLQSSVDFDSLSPNQVKDLQNLSNHLALLVPDLEELSPEKEEDSVMSDIVEEPLESLSELPDDVHEDNILQISQVTSEVKELSEQVHDIFEQTEYIDKVVDPKTVDYEVALSKIESLQKQSSSFSDKLIKDMLELDSIVGDADIKPMRKKNVVIIQSLLDDLEKIDTKLRTIQASIKKQHLAVIEKQKEELLAGLDEEQRKEKLAEMEKEISQREEEILEQEELARMTRLAELEEEAQSRYDRTGEDVKMTDTSFDNLKEDMESELRKMKLDPKFSIEKKNYGYSIQGYLPGLDKKDITVDLNQNILVISGVRLPTDTELDIMTAKLASSDIPESLYKQSLLRMGAGRYGRFNESYNLPPNTDKQNIKATYESGVLRVIVPVKPPTPFRQTRRRHPFFSDSDLWI